jgi:hypothetical protein
VKYYTPSAQSSLASPFIPGGVIGRASDFASIFPKLKNCSTRKISDRIALKKTASVNKPVGLYVSYATHSTGLLHWLHINHVILALLWRVEICTMLL